ncbi:MAG: heme ABC exporter ATP-binding protein CcmA [Sedimentisphaerales bacterium]|nr:heme ABC exporter ATP-binding protein CcmA [Sedimentisphaerales bacterium]
MTGKPDTASGHTPIIDINGLCMAFESRLVLNKIDLQVHAGQSLCLCGSNGAGKSTLMRILAGLLHPTRGTVKINALELPKKASAVKSLLGVISHKSMLYPDLTVSENLMFAARLYGVPHPSQRVNELLDDAALTGYRHDKTGILSRGMMQRLAIARALVHQPRILLADEPFTGLDLNSGRHLVDTMHCFRQNSGTILMTTHETSYGLKCCERVVVLDGGQLIFDAPTSDIDHDRFISDYLTYARSAS